MGLPMATHHWKGLMSNNPPMVAIVDDERVIQLLRLCFTLWQIFLCELRPMSLNRAWCP